MSAEPDKRPLPEDSDDSDDEPIGKKLKEAPVEVKEVRGSIERRCACALHASLPPVYI